LASNMDSYFLIIKMTAVLALVLGLMGLFFWLLKRFGSVKLTVSKGMIDVIEHKAIAPKRYISVIKVGKCFYLLGSTDSQITLIDAIDIEKITDFKDTLNKEIERQSK